MSALSSAYRLLAAGERLPADNNCEYRFLAAGGAVETEYCSGHFSGQCRCESHPAWTDRLVSRVYAAQRVSQCHADDRAWYSSRVDRLLDAAGL